MHNLGCGSDGGQGLGRGQLLSHRGHGVQVADGLQGFKTAPSPAPVCVVGMLLGSGVPAPSLGTVGPAVNKTGRVFASLSR